MNYVAGCIIALFVLAALFIAATYEDLRDSRNAP
jgi:hypothetical protein